jgi:hypothetical protein
VCFLLTFSRDFSVIQIKLSPSGSRRIWEKVRDADGQNETVPE